jgi:hypothetical protein
MPFQLFRLNWGMLVLYIAQIRRTVKIVGSQGGAI